MLKLLRFYNPPTQLIPKRTSNYQSALGLQRQDSNGVTRETNFVPRYLIEYSSGWETTFSTLRNRGSIHFSGAPLKIIVGWG